MCEQGVPKRHAGTIREDLFAAVNAAPPARRAIRNKLPLGLRKD